MLNSAPQGKHCNGHIGNVFVRILERNSMIQKNLKKKHRTCKHLLANKVWSKFAGRWCWHVATFCWNHKHAIDNYLFWKISRRTPPKVRRRFEGVVFWHDIPFKHQKLLYLLHCTMWHHKNIKWFGMMHGLFTLHFKNRWFAWHDILLEVHDWTCIKICDRILDLASKCGVLTAWHYIAKRSFSPYIGRCGYIHDKIRYDKNDRIG